MASNSSKHGSNSLKDSEDGTASIKDSENGSNFLKISENGPASIKDSGNGSNSLKDSEDGPASIKNSENDTSISRFKKMIVLAFMVVPCWVKDFLMLWFGAKSLSLVACYLIAAG
ncbi:14683_t:CDS:1, partial [Racocetra fulgida]